MANRNFDVTVKVQEDFTKGIFKALELKGREFRGEVHSATPIVAADVAASIHKEIQAIPKLGRFLSNRTAVIVTWSDGVANITVKGLPEGQVKDRTRSDGSIPQVSNGNVNLWNVLVFGRISDPSRGPVDFEKDDGGIGVHRKARSAGKLRGAKAEIDRLLKSLPAEVKMKGEAFAKSLSSSAVNAMLDYVEHTSHGRVKTHGAARPALAAAGISAQTLADNGITDVGVTSKGQIFYQTTVPKTGMKVFVSGKSIGAPTKVG